VSVARNSSIRMEFFYHPCSRWANRRVDCNERVSWRVTYITSFPHDHGYKQDIQSSKSDMDQATRGPWDGKPQAGCTFFPFTALWSFLFLPHAA
jgi:hypothetical protein